MASKNDLVTLTDSGLYCRAGDFYIDPWRPVELAIITHAHADHARPSHRSYVAHPSSEVGDLIHGKMGLDPTVSDLVAAWRNRPLTGSLNIVLIKGNHDLNLSIPKSWGIEEATKDIEEDDFVFRHAPKKERRKHAPSRFEWAGHVHPVVNLRTRWDSLRLPCFVVGADAVLLPAFGLTTGGFAISRNNRERILAIADDQVIEV